MKTASYLLRCALLLAALGPASALAQLDPPGPTYATWNSRMGAVQALWDARITYNRQWAWGTSYQNLHQDIRSQIATGSGRTGANAQNPVYLIPKVSIRSINLPRGLHHLAAALLRLDLATAGAAFYPAYTDSEGINYIANTAYQNVGTYQAYLGAEARSRHNNNRGYLPAVNLANVNCPAGVSTPMNAAWNAPPQGVGARAAAMDALDHGNLAAFNNRQKWHCYAIRATPPGDNTANAYGYVEIGHPDGGTREYSDSNDGRIVYDYVNGKVFYTPTHYRPTYRNGGALQESGNNDCPVGQTCASPFFEIVQ